jgi:hypothetical protein
VQRFRRGNHVASVPIAFLRGWRRVTATLVVAGEWTFEGPAEDQRRD